MILTLVMVSQVESDHWACIADEFQLKYNSVVPVRASLCCYFMLCYLAMAVYKFDSVFVTRWTTSKLQKRHFWHNLYVFCERFAR
jgi:hypothetical protein